VVLDPIGAFYLIVAASRSAVRDKAVVRHVLIVPDQMPRYEGDLRAEAEAPFLARWPAKGIPALADASVGRTRII
jgi:hypothetical protein